MKLRLHNKILRAAISALGALLLCLPAATQDAPSTGPNAKNNIEQPIVVLRALDKITARITELEVPVGAEAQFGTLFITPRYCRTRPPIEPPETFAYLEIDDHKQTGRERVFSGWMVASSPALNPLEHAVYDVWVLNCITASGDVAAGIR